MRARQCFRMGRLAVLGSALSSVLPRSPPRPASSLVLSCMLRQAGLPPWTAWYVARGHVTDDQWGQSHFNWPVDGVNYHVLRTGAFPFIKYHVSRRPEADLGVEDVFYRVLKVANLGLPTLLYGLAGLLWARHTEVVLLPGGGSVTVYFWYREDRGSPN